MLKRARVRTIGTILQTSHFGQKRDLHQSVFTETLQSIKKNTTNLKQKGA